VIYITVLCLQKLCAGQELRGEDIGSCHVLRPIRGRLLCERHEVTTAHQVDGLGEFAPREYSLNTTTSSVVIETFDLPSLRYSLLSNETRGFWLRNIPSKTWLYLNKLLIMIFPLTGNT
jgi:hypothetical protein